MSRSARFDRLAHLARVSATERPALRQRSRREWLIDVGRAGAAGAVASVALPVERLIAAPSDSSLRVGIVGAGLAGLACADRLAAQGVVADVFDAGSRVGGRIWSLRGFFPGQVAERGGEFIDTAHKTVIGYAKRFGLALEDVSKEPGEVAYHFGGQHVAEAAVVEEFRAFVDVMRRDLRRLSNEVTAFSHTDADIALDRTSLAEYLDGANALGAPAGPLARAVIEEAYIAEYGLEAAEQSALNFLFFIHADRRSKFTPFGIFSDERYHVLDGNDGIVAGLAQALPRPVTLGAHLVAVRRTAAGAVELSFDTAGGTLVRTYDVVVLALPFTLLREVWLDPSLALPAGKRDAIDRLGYGANAKMMLGFSARPWAWQGSNGSSYSDLASHQATWETNPRRASASRAILTDYSGGDRGATLDTGSVQAEAALFLDDLDLVYPGAATAATRRTDDTLVAHLEHWPSNPLSKGSYTCYRPGQFTSIAGWEGVPVGNLYFAGEHTDSFYSYQGFMEGAALSGLAAAAGILKAAKK